MRLLNQPKIDWNSYQRSLDLLNKNRDLDFRTPTIQLDDSALGHFDWSLPKPTRVQSPAVSSQPPSAQQRATLSP